MKKFVPLLISTILLFTVVEGEAQDFTIVPEVSSASVHPSVWDEVAYSLVVNNGTMTTDFGWEREIVDITPEWNIAVCDKNQCHDWATDNEEFTMAPGEQGTLDVHAYPMSTLGYAVVLVHVWELDDPETVVTGTYYFNTSVGVSERLSEAITIYPNPAEDLIFIDKGTEEQISRIEIYSLSGKLVIDERLMSNNAVEVSALPTGTYVARLFGDNGAQLSTNLVVKK